MTEATLNLSVQQERAEQFHALHAQAPLVLANVWDAGSAHIIGAAGPTAIATSSGGCPGRPEFRTETS
jgi:2-methylisocitrate lyase-like PEP mutase family enzyme